MLLVYGVCMKDSDNKSPFIDWSAVGWTLGGIGIFIWVAVASSGASGTSSSESVNEYQPDTCIEDCSGHNAGYEWAQEHDIQDTSYDNGNSESFNEGVRDYAEQN